MDWYLLHFDLCSSNSSLGGKATSLVGPERCRRLRETDLGDEGNDATNCEMDFPDLLDRRSFLADDDPLAATDGDWLNNLFTPPL